MNMMLNSVATDEALPSYIADVRRMVREADEPELMASYERCEELEKLLARVRTVLDDWRHAELINVIDDALDRHRVLS